MKFIYSLLLSVTMLAAQFANAADEALSATLEAHKVVRAADGKESFASADKSQPDDVLEYRTVYRNNSTQTLRKVAATLPIPQGFEYIPNTATAKAQASLDGKSYSPVPLMRIVKLPQGGTEVRPVPATEYRFLRWQLGDLPAGATSTVVARVRMSNELPQAAAAR